MEFELTAVVFKVTPLRHCVTTASRLYCVVYFSYKYKAEMVSQMSQEIYNLKTSANTLLSKLSFSTRVSISLKVPSGVDVTNEIFCSGKNCS